MGKKLWTDEDDGNKIEIKNTSNSEEEAIFISDTIEELKRSGQEINSCAILVRASYQTRSFEDRFIKIVPKEISRILESKGISIDDFDFINPNLGEV